MAVGHMTHTSEILLWKLFTTSRELCLRHDVRRLVSMTILIWFMNTPADGGTASKLLTNGVFYSDDVILTRDQAAAIFGVNHEANNRSGSDVTTGRRRRGVVTNPVNLWTLPIFYKIDPSYYPEDRDMIRAALQHISDQTCIPFFEVNPYAELPIPHVLFLQYSAGCLSYIGRIPLKRGEPQILSLPYYCLQLGKAVHEILHTLGVWHEHQRPDRDRYIRVHNDVISARYAANFRISPRDGVTSFGLPYDYGSVMHYGVRHGSINNSATISPIDGDYKGNLGQRIGLSFLDAKRLNLAYCKDKCSIQLPCQNGGYPDPNHCDVCRCPPGLTGHLCTEVATPTGARCGGQYFARVGDTITVTSPGYPEGIPYPDAVECSWLVQTKTKAFFEITFSSMFNVPNPRDKDTCYNWLEVRRLSNMAVPGYRFCDSSRPPEYLSINSRSLLFILKSNLSDEPSAISSQYFVRGFSLTVAIKARNGKDEPGSEKNTSQSWIPTRDNSSTLVIEQTTPMNCAVTWSNWSPCQPTGQCACGGCTDVTTADPEGSMRLVLILVVNTIIFIG